MDKKYKILVVLPLYGGSLPIGEYCVQALKDLGHRVEVFEAAKFHSSYVALNDLQVSAERNSYLRNTFGSMLSEAVYAKAERFAPDIVFAMAQAPLTRPILKRFEKDNIPTAMWFVEDYELFTYWRAYANLYKHFFVIQKDPFLNLLKDGGHQSAHYLPLAAQPSFHKKIELDAHERSKYGADLAFLGAGYANRRYEFRRLTSYNFKIWGSDWEGDHFLASYLQNNGKRVSPEDSVKIYNATKINLNLHSSTQSQKKTMGDFVNPRTFELASMQAFQLVDTRSLMAELFECEGENKELITFNSFDEAPALIDYYLQNPEEREEVAIRARKRIEKEHSYQHRMQTMLEIIDAPIRLQEANDAAIDEISEDLREEFLALMKRLELAPTSSFDEVIYALTKESKPLDAFETSILFLSEWKKYYG